LQNKDNVSLKPINKLAKDIDYYIENGKFVFTELYLKNRGFCCNNACRHCPYRYKIRKNET